MAANVNTQPSLDELKKNSNVNPADTYQEKGKSFSETIKTGTGSKLDQARAERKKVEPKDSIFKKVVNKTKEYFSTDKEKKPVNREYIPTGTGSKLDQARAERNNENLVEPTVEDKTKMQAGDISTIPAKGTPTTPTITDKGTPSTPTTITDKGTPSTPTTPTTTTDDGKTDGTTDEGKEDNLTNASNLDKTIGKDPPADPEEAKIDVKSIIQMLSKDGIVKIDPETGKISFADLQLSKKPMLPKIMSALSVAATVLSGGALPPINFMKLSDSYQDAVKKDEAMLEQYNNLVQKLSEKYGDIIAKANQANVGDDDLKKIGNSEYLASEQSGKDAADTESEKQLAEFENNLQKDYAKYENDIKTDSELKLKAKDHEYEMIRLYQTEANAEQMASLLNDLEIKKEPEKLLYMFNELNNTPEGQKMLQDKEYWDEVARIYKSNNGITRADDALNKAGKIVDTGVDVINGIRSMVPGLNMVK